MCVCVCVCVLGCACVCVCVCVLRQSPALSTRLEVTVWRDNGEYRIVFENGGEVSQPLFERFVANFRADWSYDPGFYAAATYTEAAVLDATLSKVPPVLPTRRDAIDYASAVLAIGA